MPEDEKEELYEDNEKEPEVEKEGSDLDFVRERLQDESGGMDAYSQALDKIQDPQLKEIIAAIQEDEQKHQAALEQWLSENGGGSEGEDEPPEEEAPAEDEPEAVEDVPVESDEDIEPDAMIPVDEGEGESDKADLIEDIRAILEEHDEGLDKGLPEMPAPATEKPFGKEADDDEDEDEDEEENLAKIGDVKAGDITIGKDDEEEEDEEDEELSEIAEKCHAIHKAFRVPIIKADRDQQIVYGVVSEPNTVDLQGDRLSESEIRKACHKFMQTSQRIGKEHEGEAKADIIESYIAPTEFTCNGQRVQKGSWVMAVKVIDPGLWRDIKKGDITGFSIAGTGTRTDI